jgi:hypothetical protein
MTTTMKTPTKRMAQKKGSTLVIDPAEAVSVGIEHLGTIPVYEDETPYLKELTVKQLRAVAKNRGIKLKGAKKKKDIIKAIANG